jgi:hypothetical protein
MLLREFPEAFGPWGTIPCDQSLKLKLAFINEDRTNAGNKAASNPNVYYVAAGEPDQLRDDLYPLDKNGGIELRGKLSELSPITLDAETRAQAGIHKDAEEFAWAYPLDAFETIEKVEHLRHGKFKFDPVMNFLAYGGFVYLKREKVRASSVASVDGESIDAPKDERGQLTVVSINVLNKGKGLEFDGPFPWQHHDTGLLASQFCPVTGNVVTTSTFASVCWCLILVLLILLQCQICIPKEPGGSPGSHRTRA